MCCCQSLLTSFDLQESSVAVTQQHSNRHDVGVTCRDTTTAEAAAAAAAEPCGASWEVRLSAINPILSPGISPDASLQQALQSNAPLQHTTPSKPDVDVWLTSGSEPNVPELMLCASPQVSTQGLAAGHLNGSQPDPKPTVDTCGQQQHMRPDGSPITRRDVSKAAPHPPHKAAPPPSHKAAPQVAPSPQQQGPRAAQHKANKQQPAGPHAAGPGKPPASAAAKAAGQPSRQGAKPKVAGHKPRWNASTRVSHHKPR